MRTDPKWQKLCVELWKPCPGNEGVKLIHYAKGLERQTDRHTDTQADRDIHRQTAEGYSS